MQRKYVYLTANHLSDDLLPLLSCYGLACLAANLSVSLGTKRLENLPLLINTQHHSFFQIAICRLWRQMPFIKDVFHPTSYTVDHSLSGQSSKSVDCACKSRDLEIAHTCCAISRLPAQSQDWNAI